MAKEKVHCGKCGKQLVYEAKELKKPELGCPACGSTVAVEARAVARFVRMAPRKLRLVADAIRGKKVKDALVFLRFAPKRAAKTMSKIVESARANAENTYKMDPDNLVVTGVFVDGGPVFKRFMPRAMGRAAMIRKRTSHVTVRVREQLDLTVERENKRAAHEKTRRPAAPKAREAKPKEAKLKAEKAPKSRKKSEEKQGEA